MSDHRLAREASPVICTIIAKNYVSMARVLCDSFLTHHPNGSCYALFIDDWRTHVNPSQERFIPLSLSDLAIPNLTRYCFQYDIMELSTAVKPALLQYLLKDRHVGSVLYMDTDILVTDSLDDLFARFSQHEVLLTPHLD